jgi:hypothetical protein
MHPYLIETSWTDEWLVYLTGGLVFFTAALCVVSLIIALKANRWAHKYWHKQKKEEINYHLETIRFQGKLEAAKAAWGLLAYLSENENENNFLIYRGTKVKPEVFFNLERGRKYIKTLSEIFHEKGHGIFLTSGIKDVIFHVRRNVYDILTKESHRGNVNGEVLIENPGVVEFIKKNYESLRSQIKKYVLEELQYFVEE